MHGAHEFLKAITVVLCVAAVTTVLFQRLRLPIVLGYILAGLIVGPYVPIPLVADREIVQTLSELGVILVMFAIGLEFRLGKLFRIGPTAGLTALIESSMMVWLGFMVARAFGWTMRESIFAGAIVAISSTTIIAKTFDEQGVARGLRELVFGILIVEDLIAILLMAILTALSSGDGVSAATIASSSGRLAAFLIGLVAVGMLVVPRAMRAINRLKRSETTLVASMGICFAVALLAHKLGYSVALGAFVAGSMVAESGESKQIEHLILPVRDLFAAIFFVSVGMSIDPELVVHHWRAVSVFAALVIGGKFVGVSTGAFLTGNGTQMSVKAGMSLTQIGEFSFIIAGLGVMLGATREFLYPVAVAVSAITTLTTPLLIRAAGPAASFLDHKLPKPLQTFAALYGTWVEQLRAPRAAGDSRWSVRRLVKLLVLDCALLVGLIIGASLFIDRVSALGVRELGLSPMLARAAVLVAVLLLATPMIFGVFNLTQRLGMSLGQPLSSEPNRADLAATPRRALVATLQLAIVLVIGLPVVALTRPFFPAWLEAILLALVVLVLGVAFWRSATNLQGHVKAGAELIIEALAAQGKADPHSSSDDALAHVQHLMPGLGAPIPLKLDAESIAVGKTLAELDLRGRTGASVLAIARGKESVLIPTAAEKLHVGDVLALAGTRHAVASAARLLQLGDDAAPEDNSGS